MACYHPWTAWRARDGEILFREKGDCDAVQLPCGRCVGCRLEQSRQWATRIMHEVQTSAESSYITLTYEDEKRGGFDRWSLEYEDFRLFLRRVRERWYPVKQIRFFMAGEYGEAFGRPHFHSIIFGHDFRPWTYFKKSASGSNVYRSLELESLWKQGFSSVGTATFESAAYVARYVMKKVVGEAADDWYDFLDVETGEYISRCPEFCQMSRMPGIGHEWLKRFRSDVYPDGRCVVNGVLARAPRYYDRKYLETGGDGDRMEFSRYVAAVRHAADSSNDRLLAREIVATARMKFLKRTID